MSYEKLLSFAHETILHSCAEPNWESTRRSRRIALMRTENFFPSLRHAQIDPADCWLRLFKLDPLEGVEPRFIECVSDRKRLEKLAAFYAYPVCAVFRLSAEGWSEAERDVAPLLSLIRLGGDVTKIANSRITHRIMWSLHSGNRDAPLHRG